MNDRDKHLSLAIDALLKTYEIAKRDEFFYRYMDTIGVLAELRTAHRHMEEAAEMPKPSRLRIIRRLWKEAA